MEKSPLAQDGHSTRHWHPTVASYLPMIVGAGICFVLPITYGIYVIVQEQTYWASHPLGPNEGRCGMGMMLAFAMIFVVAPVSAAFGALIGWGIGLFYSS